MSRDRQGVRQTEIVRGRRKVVRQRFYEANIDSQR